MRREPDSPIFFPHDQKGVKMRALVTGGAGFIGSHLVDVLLKSGDDVTVVDNLARGRMANVADALVRGARLVRADVTNGDAIENAMRGARAEVVYHLAAQIDVRESVRDPSADAQVDGTSVDTVAVLEAARRAGVGRVILVSTAAVYGNALKIPTPEAAALAPLSPYGAGKAAAETYAALFSRATGMSTLSARLANVYGPRQDPHGEAGVISIFCAAAAERRPAIIFGDGTRTRDYVYVGDVAHALRAAGRARLTGAVNLSTGTETPLTKAVAGHLDLDVVRAPERAGELKRSCLDPTGAPRRASSAARAETWLAEGLGPGTLPSMPSVARSLADPAAARAAERRCRAGMGVASRPCPSPRPRRCASSSCDASAKRASARARPPTSTSPRPRGAVPTARRTYARSSTSARSRRTASSASADSG